MDVCLLNFIISTILYHIKKIKYLYYSTTMQYTDAIQFINEKQNNYA